MEDNHRHSSGSSALNVVIGTYVNDEKALGPRLLEAGDRISPVADPTPEQPVFEVGPTLDPVPPGTALQPEPKGCLATLTGIFG